MTIRTSIRTTVCISCLQPDRHTDVVDRKRCFCSFQTCGLQRQHIIQGQSVTRRHPRLLISVIAKNKQGCKRTWPEPSQLTPLTLA